MTKARDIADFKFEDIVDTGTEGTKVASGTTAQRGSTTGQFRFNSTSNLAEYYDGTTFKSIDSPPVINSIDDDNIDSAGGGNQTIVITGSNFSSTVTVLLVANSGSNITPSTVTRNSATQITITHAKNQFVNANEPYDVKVTNTSGLSGTLADAISVDNDPTWSTSAGALSGSPFNEGDTLNVTLSATDPDGDTVAYSLQSGALPSGISLNSSTGVLSGTLPEESSNVTYNFTIRATANTKTADRAFSLQNNDDTAPTWTTASGTLATVFDGGRSGFSTTVVASDAQGDTIAYSVLSGSLPSGASLNTSTGAISGNLGGVGSDTTSTFTIRATANGKTVDRQFNIIVKAPTITAFTSSGTFTVPSGLTNVAILIVAGGGSGGVTNPNSGGAGRGGGGGAGGLIYIPSWNLTGASSYTVTVGNGGTVAPADATNGQNSVVSGGSKTLTANGGGHGGFGDNTNNAESGGSGGGGWYSGYTGKASTQPTNTSDGVNTYNSTGYGSAGGDSSHAAPYGAGGGGATGVGQNWNGGQQGGTGFNGNTYGFNSYGESGYFASGGTSATVFGTNTATRVGGGGQGHQHQTSPSNAAANGQANTGGGGGAGGHGGSGVVLLKY